MDQNYQIFLLLIILENIKKKSAAMYDFAINMTWKEVPDPYYGGPEDDLRIDLRLDAYICWVVRQSVRL